MLTFQKAILDLSAKINIGYELAYEAMGELLADKNCEILDADIAKFIMGLGEKGEEVEEVNGLVDALIEAGDKVELANAPEKYIDTCGTGGDKQHTINVSTLAGLVVASASQQTGIKVLKHGNRSVSSKSGSADILEALGVNIHLGSEGVEQCLEVVGFGFCFARYFHTSFGRVAKVRTEIAENTKHKQTIFNVLGPLSNPGKVGCQLIGVSNPALAELVAEVLRAKNLAHGLVVYADIGMDEISTLGTTQLIEIQSSKITKTQIQPEDFGICPLDSLKELQVNDLDEAVQVSRLLLDDAKPEAKLDIVALNAGAAFYISQATESIQAGYELAKNMLEEKKTAQLLDKLAIQSQQYKNHELADFK